MDGLFLGIAEATNPGREELAQFTRDVESFLRFVVIDSDEFAFLWTDATHLRSLAISTLQEDVPRSAGMLRDVIPQVSGERLDLHGLRGRPLRFKLNVLAHLARLWDRVKGKLTVRPWFRRVCEAIDAILDSLIDAAGAVGAVLKEFKDSLMALAPDAGGNP